MTQPKTQESRTHAGLDPTIRAQLFKELEEAFPQGPRTANSDGVKGMVITVLSMLADALRRSGSPVRLEIEMDRGDDFETLHIFNVGRPAQPRFKLKGSTICIGPRDFYIGSDDGPVTLLIQLEDVIFPREWKPRKIKF